MYSGLGLTPPAALDPWYATAYDYTYVWDGSAWKLDNEGWVVEGALLSDPDRLARKPFLDLLRQKPPPYRIVSRYYLAQKGNEQVWQHLGYNSNYEFY